MRLCARAYRTTLAPLSAFLFAFAISACGGDGTTPSGSTSGSGGAGGAGGMTGSGGAGGAGGMTGSGGAGGMTGSGGMGGGGGMGGSGGMNCGASSNCNGTPLWSKRFGDNSVEGAESIAVDTAGNILITGHFWSTVDFGGGPLACAGGDDIFIAKLDPNGNHLWSKHFGDADNQFAFTTTVDAAGNVLLTGKFQGTVDFGGGPLVSAGGVDVFVAKFDPDGNHLWSKRFGDIGSELATTTTVDSAGNVLVAGYFTTTVDFGGGPLATAGNYDIFIAKLDPNGNHLWSKRFGDTGSQFAHDTAVDATGNIVLSGSFGGAVDFGGGPLTSANKLDIFVARFDPNGNHLWSKRFGGAGDQIGRSTAVDAAGNVLLAGEFLGNVDFGGEALASMGQYDFYLAKLDPSGNHLWSKRFGDASDQIAHAIAVDTFGNVLITGEFDGTVDFGKGPLTSAGLKDIFLAKLDPDGNPIWSKGFGDTSFQFAYAAAVDAADNVLITGRFGDTVDFGNGPLTSAGTYDIFLAKFSP